MNAMDKPRRMLWTAAVGVAALTLLFARPCFSQTAFRLEFDVDGILPSTQGFTYVSSGHSGTFPAPETLVFSVSGGLLHMNTAALGPMMGAAYYEKAGIFDPALDLIMEMRMRLYQDSTRDFFLYSIATDETFAGIIFEEGRIHLFRQPRPFATFPVPDTDFHTYRIHYRGATRQYTVFLDGAVLGGPQAFVYTGAAPIFAFGDPTAHPGFNGRADVDYIQYVQFQQVSIDIKPGSFPNSINVRSHGTVPLAILSTAGFDATKVDRTSLTFGRTGNEISLGFCGPSPEDANGDGLADLVCHFNTQQTGFQGGDTQGVLKGSTVGGVSILGTDSVRITP